MHLCIYASYAAVYKLVYISYTSLRIYASMHPMQMIKLVFYSNGLISCLVSKNLKQNYAHPLLEIIIFFHTHNPL